MGNPEHFSLEVPGRAHQLLQRLYNDLGDTAGEGLSLRATFLLSLSMPILILPIERIQKFGKGHMNDGVVNERLAATIKRAINKDDAVQGAEFFVGKWRYASLPKGNGFPNLAADGLPEDIAKVLDENQAIEAARRLTADSFCRILRNALAHGGVLYLNQKGRSRPGAPVRAFAFVSTGRVEKTESLHFLRIGMADYRAFLKRWVQWLADSSVDKIMERDFMLEADDSVDDGLIL